MAENLFSRKLRFMNGSNLSFHEKYHKQIEKFVYTFFLCGKGKREFFLYNVSI